MAQVLFKFRSPMPDVLCRWTCLISTILVFCSCCCVGVSGQDRHSICEKDGWCESPNNPILMEQSDLNQTGLGSSDSATLDPLELRSGTWSGMTWSGTFNGEDAQFSASKFGPGWKRIGVSSIMSVSRSRSVCNEVYYAHIYLELSISSGMEFAIKQGLQRPFYFVAFAVVQGVLSNRTDRFCATFCLGEPDDGEDRAERSMALARLAYRMEHPESTTFPDTLVAQDCEVHIELDLPKVSTIANPFVSGVLTSLRSPDDPSYFHPLTIASLSEAPYEFNRSVQEEAHILGASAMPDISRTVHKNLKPWSDGPPFCSKDQTTGMAYAVRIYSPTRNSSCGSSEGGLCSPFPNSDISPTFNLPEVTLLNIQCSQDWRISAAFLFDFTPQRVWLDSKADQSSSTATTEFLLVAEGYWNFYKPGQLVMMAHCLASDGTFLDSKILITLQMPMARTLHHRYGIIGHVRSTREALDPLYFASISFVGNFQLSSIGEIHDGKRATLMSEQDFSYDYDDSIYTKIQPVCSLAADAYKVHKNARFPDGSTAADLEAYFLFAMPGEVNSTEQIFSLSNLAIDQEFREHFNQFLGSNKNGKPSVHSPRHSTNREYIPVSFRLTLIGSFPFRLAMASVELEGFYDSITGHLCLLGCRRRWEDVALPYEEEENTSQCDLVFSIQYPPTNPRLWSTRPFITGTIRSLHDAGHPLYFEPLAINASLPTAYRVHTQWIFFRRNAETIMSLVSLSLVTFVTAVQVGYSSRVSNSRNLRFVSLVMLTVFTSGHFFPLLLSLNALWTKLVPFDEMERYAMFNGWPETREVIVRGTTMVSLLLALRLVQLVWRSRTRADNSNSQIETDPAPSNVSDVSVLKACLPIYGTMTVVIAYVHWLGPYQEQAHYFGGGQMLAYVWADLQAFSGVIVDLFLLPQVIANVLWDTEEKVAPLYPLFYLGMTVVRSVAHLYDAARAWNFVPEWLSWNYNYANPNWDLYSTTWDIVIPCFSVSLAIVLHLQQRYGGRRVIPKRFRRQKYQRVESQEVDL